MNSSSSREVTPGTRQSSALLTAPAVGTSSSITTDEGIFWSDSSFSIFNDFLDFSRSLLSDPPDFEEDLEECEEVDAEDSEPDEEDEEEERLRLRATNRGRSSLVLPLSSDWLPLLLQRPRP